jgi:hypothetical protein
MSTSRKINNCMQTIKAQAGNAPYLGLLDESG